MELWITAILYIDPFTLHGAKGPSNLTQEEYNSILSKDGLFRRLFFRND
jgi:hypothetical protein